LLHFNVNKQSNCWFCELKFFNLRLFFFVLFVFGVCLAMAPAHKFCNRCNRKHAAPTGKRKCRLPLLTDDFADENSFDTLVDVDEDVVGAASDGASAPVSEPLATPPDVQADTLTQILSVVSLLAGKVEATQQQVAVLQADTEDSEDGGPGVGASAWG
jgi:hypothetical protein